MNLAPIILFCYNRPANTKNTLDALSKNDLADESILIIYCDGPKIGASTVDIQSINQVRKLVEEENRFKEVQVVKRIENLGLAQSIIKGVSETINAYGSAIVLEDDILCSKYFIKFMNDALDKYKDHPKVFSIGACNYFALGKNVPSTFAIPVADCWGWATWKSRWDLFESDSKKLLSLIEVNNLQKEFSLLGYYDFYGMLKSQIEGKISSWAIRWQAVIFLNNMLTIYPNPSVTQHVESANATHAKLNVLPPIAVDKITISDEPVLLDEKILKKMLKGYFIGLSNDIFKRLRLNFQFAIKSKFDSSIKQYVRKVNNV